MADTFNFTIRESVDASARARLVRIDLGGAPFPFEAGQAVMSGLVAAGTLRPYSLACSPAQSLASGCLELLVGVMPEERRASHLGLGAPGDPVTVSAPFGSFALPPVIEQHHLLLIGGGSGVAPLRAQLWDALERHESRFVSLIYSARTADDFCFEREFRRLHDDQRIRYIPTATREVSPPWLGHRGRVDSSLLSPLVAGEATLCSVCGPNGFVVDVTQMLVEAGVPDANILRERY